MATLDVIFALGPNSEPFVRLALQLMTHLESGLHEVRYKGIQGGSNVSVPGIDVVAKIERQPGPGDMTHAAVLDEMMNHVESDYTLITDSDVAVLRQDWDDVCIRELVNDVAAIGFKIPDRRCVTFPCVRFCMFDSQKLIECQPEFTPVLTGGARSHPVTGGAGKYAKHLGIGTVYKDTGWKMPVPFHENGYRGLVMPFIRLSSDKVTIPALDDAQRKRMKGRILGHEEYHWKGELFATHKGQVRRGFKINGLWESRVISYAEQNFQFRFER